MPSFRLEECTAKALFHAFSWFAQRLKILLQYWRTPIPIWHPCQTLINQGLTSMSNIDRFESTIFDYTYIYDSLSTSDPVTVSTYTSYNYCSLHVTCYAVPATVILHLHGAVIYTISASMIAGIFPQWSAPSWLHTCFHVWAMSASFVRDVRHVGLTFGYVCWAMSAPFVQDLTQWLPHKACIGIRSPPKQMPPDACIQFVINPPFLFCRLLQER